MGNQYRALTPAARAAYSDGVFDHEFTVTDERDAITSGLVELVPRPYRVLSPNYSAGAPGDVFEAAFLVEIEAMLVAGGHIERVRRDASPTVDAAAEPVKKTARKAT